MCIWRHLVNGTGNSGEWYLLVTKLLSSEAPSPEKWVGQCGGWRAGGGQVRSECSEARGMPGTSGSARAVSADSPSRT